MNEVKWAVRRPQAEAQILSRELRVFLANAQVLVRLSTRRCLTLDTEDWRIKK